MGRWITSRGRHIYIRDKDEQIPKLEQYGRDSGSYKTLFSLPKNVDDANEIARYNFRLGDYKNMKSPSDNDRPVEEIDLDSLSNSQEIVNKEKIDAMMKLGLEKLSELEDEQSTGLPYVIHYGNTNLIMDGHHRLTALKALGAKTANVRYFDLEKYKKGTK